MPTTFDLDQVYNVNAVGGGVGLIDPAANGVYAGYASFGVGPGQYEPGREATEIHVPLLVRVARETVTLDDDVRGSSLATRPARSGSPSGSTLNQLPLPNGESVPMYVLRCTY